MTPDVVGFLFPKFKARWLMERRLLENVRTYDAAQSSNFRPNLMNITSGDGVMNITGSKLRQLARHMDENHDLVVAVLDDLVNNTIGAGVMPAPMVRQAGTKKKLAEAVNDQILDLWEEWSEYPETTGEFAMSPMERIVARSLFRDGELFIQNVLDKRFRFRSDVPYVMELLEADFVPFEYYDQERNVLHGVECDAWNTPIGYYVLRNHPGDPLGGIPVTLGDLKRIPAEAMIHLKFTRRLRQRRGVPVLHAVINRLRDLKDYEESERIAAKVAADLTAFIKRNAENQYTAVVNGQRQFQMSAGSFFELQPGEDVGTIQSDRPNANLVTFRDAMLRAVAGGTGTRFSSIARNYNGTYSAQRQELVEGAIAYRAQFAYLCAHFYRPVYQNFVTTAWLSGALKLPRGVDLNSLKRCDFRAPALPWIDPAKEATAYRELVDAQLESRQEIMRQRGRDPGKVWDEIEQEQQSGLFVSAVDKAGATDAVTPADQTEEAA